MSAKNVIVNTQLILYLHIAKILKQKINQIICTMALKFMQFLNENLRCFKKVRQEDISTL